MSHPAPPGARLPPTGPVRDRAEEVRTFVRRAVPFVLLGLTIYLGLYGASEWLVYDRTVRNPFHKVKTAPRTAHDYVILGASHAAVFDYRDMTARLEEMTGAEILNLASVGSGVVPNRLALDYFYAEGHETDAVVYVVDSFAFYSRQWNEGRLEDAELFARAPFDLTLARLLLERPGGRSVVLDYISGFLKINDSDRFQPDLFEAEGSRFERTYRPVPQIDRQRIDFLYPEEVDEAALASSPYLNRFEDLIREVRSRGDRFVIVRPPVPDRIYDMIPAEEAFDATLRRVADRHGAELHDFTSVNDDPELFYDSDHLNREGTLRFFREHLAPLLAEGREGSVP